MRELTLGEKLRHFRTMKGISQSQLETEADLAFGTISRIENSQINPTKETINKIGEVLDLLENDLTYLIGLRDSLPAKREIDEIVQQIQPVFDQETFPSYLMDNRFRIWAYNKSLLEVFDIPPAEAEKQLGVNVLKALFRLFNILNKIPKKHLIKVLKEQIAVHKEETERYSKEDYMKEVVSELQDDREFSKLWSSTLPKASLFRRAEFYLKYKGNVLDILISRSSVPIDERFYVVEYFPKDVKTAEIFEKIREQIKK